MREINERLDRIELLRERTYDSNRRLRRADYVNPYYLEDRKQRVSIARVGRKLFAFDDLCPHEACPLSAGLLTGTTLQVRA